MKYQIRSLDPMSVGKISGLLQAVVSLVFIPIFITVMLAGMAASARQQQPSPIPSGIGIVGIALILMILLPVIYGIIGFVVGALAALVYNVLSRWVGGIVMELTIPGATVISSQEPPPYPLVPQEGHGGQHV